MEKLSNGCYLYKGLAKPKELREIDYFPESPFIISLS
jgi:hypothetical protein